MKEGNFSWDLFNKVPVIGIIRGLSLENVKGILPVYLEGGLTTIEITMNTPSATEIIRFCSEQFGDRLNIGAGTVCDSEDLNQALDAGAQFIVTPVLEPDVIRSCVDSGIPVFPGAFSPTEIFAAWKLGASMVKVYPASSLGTQFIRDVKAPLSKIKLLPTGGINLENFQQFMQAGADGIGVGGHLFNSDYIRNKNWAALKQHFISFSNYFTRYSEHSVSD